MPRCFPVCKVGIRKCWGLPNSRKIGCLLESFECWRGDVRCGVGLVVAGGFGGAAALGAIGIHKERRFILVFRSSFELYFYFRLSPPGLFRLEPPILCLLNGFCLDSGLFFFHINIVMFAEAEISISVLQPKPLRFFGGLVSFPFC